MPHRKLIIDQIRKLVPEKIASDLVSVQPLPKETQEAYKELLDLLGDHGTLVFNTRGQDDGNG